MPASIFGAGIDLHPEGCTPAFSSGAGFGTLFVRMSAYERGRAAWPDVVLDRAVFEAHMATHDADPRFASDLYLACACAAGDRAALRAFDHAFLVEVPRFIARIAPSTELADELRQTLREHLLVAAPGTRPHIADYAGRGSLGGWLRVIAVRHVHRMRRRTPENRSSDHVAADHLAASSADPETALLKARYGPELAQALRASVAELSARDRTLLKLHVIDGLSIDALCVVEGVHRSTVARWIASLRKQLLEASTRRLRAKLALDTGETESLCAALRSQLDFSLSGLLENR